MPGAAHANSGDSVFSLSGAGYLCLFPMTTSTGAATQSKVYADGTSGTNLIVSKGDIVAPHPISGCGLDSSGLSAFSTKVFCGGTSKNAGRIGDAYGPNFITSGSSKVIIG